MDLFNDDGVLRQLPVPGADVKYARSPALGFDSKILLSDLISTTPWRQEKVTVWGKSFDQPRLVAWYGDPGQVYTYSGIKLDPLAWTDQLKFVKNAVESFVGFGFNSLLLNFYRDNQDSMGFHSDNERELGHDPVIASLSLGAERNLVFKKRGQKTNESFRIKLEHGSLLLMGSGTQKNYLHGINKSRLLMGPRVNLTFRRIIG